MSPRSIVASVVLLAAACGGPSTQTAVDDAMRNRGLPPPWEIMDVLDNGDCKAAHVVDGAGTAHTVYIRNDIVITTVTLGHLAPDPAAVTCQPGTQPFNP